MAAFATVDDMIARYDVRTLGDLCADDDEQVTPLGLQTNTKMAAALSTATGQIKAAVLQAERYTTEELESLTGDGKEYLVDITCQLALWALWRRKPYTDDQQRGEIKSNAEEILEMLRKGARVFDLKRQQNAGIPKVESVSRVEVRNDWALFVDQARGRFYPARRSYKNR